MDKFGSVIASNRKRLSLTQSDLAEMLHVTPQAISKWENDISEPDLATLRKLSEIFGISLDDFFTKSNEINENDKLDDVVNNAYDICVMCLKKGKGFTNKPEGLMCDECISELDSENESINNILRTSVDSLVKRGNTRKKSFTIGGIVGAIILVLVFATYPYKEGIPNTSFLEYAIGGVVFAFLTTTLLSQLFYDSWQKDALLRFTGVSMRMPGIIFELSIDGIIWLILVKLLFGLITIIIGLVVFLFGLIVNLFISPFTYFYELGRLIKEVKA